MSFRYTVVFDHVIKGRAAASRIAFRFSMTRSVCCRTSVPANSPVAGSSAIWPETNTKPLDLTAWEYGPMGFGPRSVKYDIFHRESLLGMRNDRISDSAKERENQRGRAAVIANKTRVGMIRGWPRAWRLSASACFRRSPSLISSRICFSDIPVFFSRPICSLVSVGNP